MREENRIEGGDGTSIIEVGVLLGMRIGVAEILTCAGALEGAVAVGAEAHHQRNGGGGTRGAGGVLDGDAADGGALCVIGSKGADTGGTDIDGIEIAVTPRVEHHRVGQAERLDGDDAGDGKAAVVKIGGGRTADTGAGVGSLTPEVGGARGDAAVAGAWQAVIELGVMLQLVIDDVHRLLDFRLLLAAGILVHHRRDAAGRDRADHEHHRQFHHRESEIGGGKAGEKRQHDQQQREL